MMFLTVDKRSARAIKAVASVIYPGATLADNLDNVALAAAGAL
jgi:hypothetical protein